MVRKGSDLKPALDAYIEGLRQSGELDKILAKYGQGSAAQR
jgi:ABC-type amino acid transport substrate-binding protein